MKIRLIQLSLLNFKGIRKLLINFDEETNVFGDNGTGKTTIFDSFLWLLFGKDSTDRKDFEVKTLDDNNQPYHRLEHEVSATILIDGEEVIIRRALREKWTKKRGVSTEEFTGHETTYFWNDVPMKMEEFQGKISSLVNETIFKQITNSGYFSGLKWQDRRATLLSIAGNIDNIKVIKSLPGYKDGAFDELIKALTAKKTPEEFKKELAAKKKKVKDELDLIPSKISEANRALPEEKDYALVEADIASVVADIETLESMLDNKSKAFKDHQEQLNNLITKRQNLNRLMMDIEFTEKNAVQEKGRMRKSNIESQQRELRTLDDKIKAFRSEYAGAISEKTAAEAEQAKLRDQYAVADREQLVFNDGEFHCPACKREFEASSISEKKEELTANFNTNKAKKLSDIAKKGADLGIKIIDLSTKISNLEADGLKLKSEIEVLTNRIDELKKEDERLSADENGNVQKAIATNNDYTKYADDVKAISVKIDAPYEEGDNTALRWRKTELNKQLDELKSQLATKDTRIKQLTRIAELEDQESAMAQELASFEGVEFSIEQFTRAKMDALEVAINDRFAIVKFKLFAEQINGGQVECCDILINGVPYSDANTASKINAGLDIINTLSKHYDVYAPIFIDNRESVVRIPKMDSQIINLWVSEGDKKLRIEGARQLVMA